MALQEKIKKKAEGFGKLAPAFLEGANFALENQWISVKDDLPCNHEELLINKGVTKKVFVLKFGGFPDVDYMLKVNGKWRWFSYENSKFWMPIPESPKMGRKIGEVFEIDGVKLQVEEGSMGCVGCYFDEDKECFDHWDITGECHWSVRENKKGVIFKEVKRL